MRVALDLREWAPNPEYFPDRLCYVRLGPRGVRVERLARSNFRSSQAPWLAEVAAQFPETHSFDVADWSTASRIAIAVRLHREVARVYAPGLTKQRVCAALPTPPFASGPPHAAAVRAGARAYMQSFALEPRDGRD